MKTRNFLVTFILLFMANLEAHEETNQLPLLYKRLLPSVVTLHTFENNTAGKVTRVVTTPNGLGSGVIISKEGLIVTAAHVVHTVDALHVEFSDGSRATGKILSSVPWADLALVQVNKLPENVVPAELGDSAKVDIGERGFVIGAPLGLSHTLTVGYISGRHPAGSTKAAPLAELFQTDAAINPGNSGGPLFNMSGKVIGIASHIQTQSGGSDGLGFVVTSDSVSQILLNKAHFWSGLDYVPLDAELARVFQLPQKNGLLVQRVAEGSLAFGAGIQAGSLPATIRDQPIILGGDIILSVNGFNFDSQTNIHSIIETIANVTPGSKLTVLIWRDGKKRRLTIEVPR